MLLVTVTMSSILQYSSTSRVVTILARPPIGSLVSGFVEYTSVPVFRSKAKAAWAVSSRRSEPTSGT